MPVEWRNVMGRMVPFYHSYWAPVGPGGRYQRLSAQYPYAQDEMRFHISPTCPPSTTLNMRGGRIALSAHGGWATGKLWYVDARPFDMADVETHNREFTFTNADWYTFAHISLYYGSRPDYDWTDDWIYWAASYWTYPADYDREWPTAALAEQAALDYLAVGAGGWATAFAYGVVLGILILRNNGDTDYANQFRQIDAINRGNSYIFRYRENMIPRYLI